MKNQASFSNANSRSQALLSLLCLLLVMLALPFAAHAQDITAAVRGTVTDEQGADIAGAEVAAISADTGFSRSAMTGTDGVYNFPDLPLGNYKIRVSHSGFKA